jgi:hypothetical protein
LPSQEFVSIVMVWQSLYQSAGGSLKKNDGHYLGSPVGTAEAAIPTWLNQDFRIAGERSGLPLLALLRDFQPCFRTMLGIESALHVDLSVSTSQQLLGARFGLTRTFHINF